MIWVLLVVLIALEMSLTTPPFGISIFIMLSVSPPGTTYRTVLMSAIPYLACDLVVLLCLVAVPALVTVLPSHIGS